MYISTTTSPPPPPASTAAGQKLGACSSIGWLSRRLPSGQLRTTPSSTPTNLFSCQTHWSKGDTLSRLNLGHDKSSLPILRGRRLYRIKTLRAPRVTMRERRVSIALRHSHGEFTDFCLVVAC